MKNRISQIVKSGTPVTQANRDRAALGSRYDEFAAVNAALACHDVELAPEDFVAMTGDGDREFSDRVMLGDRYDEFTAVNAALARHDEELAPEDFVAMTEEPTDCPMAYVYEKRRSQRVRPSRSAVNRVLEMYFERV